MRKLKLRNQKFLIDKTQTQIAQVKDKIGKAQEKIKSVKRKRKLRNFFQKFNKAKIEQILKKLIKRKAQIE